MSVSFLTYGTPEEVRQACLYAIRATQGIGYFLGSTTELHWHVQLENALAMFETARRQPCWVVPNRLFLKHFLASYVL